MSNNPLLILAKTVDQTLAISEVSQFGSREQEVSLLRALQAKPSETLDVATRRTAYEAQIVAESFFANTQDGSAQYVDLKGLLELIWQVPDNVSSCMRGHQISINSTSSAYLKMAAGFTERDSIFSSSAEEVDYSWLVAILDDIDSSLPSTSIPKQLQIGISRHISIMRSLLSENVVSASFIVQQLATLSGLLCAAAQFEPDSKKSTKFMRWAIRVSAGIAVDVAIGIPVNTVTNLMLLALESGDSDDSEDAQDDDDLQDLGETVSV